jgi:hypothetical protein
LAGDRCSFYLCVATATHTKSLKKNTRNMFVCVCAVHL